MSQSIDIDELSIVRGCQNGDNTARRRLYEKFSRQLMAVCMRYVSDRDIAQDILHDGFINIFDSIKKFKYMGEGSLKAWLIKVMMNESLKYLRKNAKMNEIPYDELPDVADDEESDISDISASVLMELVRKLPDGYRTVLNLYVFEDKSHKEIASMLNISEHTSSSQYFRAKKLLTTMIKEYRDHEER